MKVSVIIPALNEAENLQAALASVGPKAEVIVSDGGSVDSTRAIAERSGAVVVVSPRGRGRQMDEGASRAGGEALLFLHADTRLPAGWLEAVTEALEDEKTVAGGFSLSIGSDKKWLRVVERIATFRSRYLGLLYGDQALFVRKESFFRAGGFNNLPLMEDVDCVKRLRKLGKIALLDEKVLTSSRRWVKGGVLRNTLKNWLILTLYCLGVSPNRLYGWYYGR